MTKAIFILIYIFTLLFIPKLALAQNTSTNSSERRVDTKKIIEDRQVRLRQRKAELQKIIKERQGSRSASLAAHKKLKIENLFNIVKRRLLATIERLESLIGRIESRLAKIEGENEDIETAKIKSDLEIAKDILIDAKANLQEAERKLALALESDDPRGGYLEVKVLMREVATDLKEAKMILAHLIGDIRGLRIGNTQRLPTRVPTVTPTIAPITPTPTVIPTPTLPIGV